MWNEHRVHHSRKLFVWTEPAAEGGGETREQRAGAPNATGERKLLLQQPLTSCGSNMRDNLIFNPTCCENLVFMVPKVGMRSELHL